MTLTAQGAEFLDEVRLVTGASLGYTNLSFPEKLDHDVSFPSASLTGAAAWKRWQLSLSGTFSMQDADLSEEEDTGDASREDIDLTLGYQINRNWSIFGGYKKAKTDMEFRSREGSDLGLADRTNESYEQDGPFLGGSFAWQFEKAGRLSISIAYAMLDATNKFGANTDDDEPDEEIEFDDLTGKVKGDTEGFSYGANWTMPLSGNVLFQTRFKVNDYKQDIKYEGQDFNNIDETFISLLVGLAYVF